MLSKIVLIRFFAISNRQATSGIATFFRQKVMIN
jgi:hypothetical protein